MAESTSDAFLSGQGIPVDPGAIESEFTRLWGPAAESAGGPELENPNVTRIVLANLIVGPGRIARRAWKSSSIRSSAIPLSTDRDPEDATSPAARSPPRSPPSATSPGPTGPRSAPSGSSSARGPRPDLLPGAIRPFLEANLPLVLWWTDDPRRDEKLFRDLAGECSRLILDLPDPEGRDGRPPPRPGTLDQSFRPRRRLVRDHPMAPTWRAVLRRPQPDRGTLPDHRRRGPGRGPRLAGHPPHRPPGSSAGLPVSSAGLPFDDWRRPRARSRPLSEPRPARSRSRSGPKARPPPAWPRSWK